MKIQLDKHETPKIYVVLKHVDYYDLTTIEKAFTREKDAINYITDRMTDYEHAMETYETIVNDRKFAGVDIENDEEAQTIIDGLRLPKNPDRCTCFWDMDIVDLKVGKEEIV